MNVTLFLKNWTQNRNKTHCCSSNLTLIYIMKFQYCKYIAITLYLTWADFSSCSEEKISLRNSLSFLLYWIIAKKFLLYFHILIIITHLCNILWLLKYTDFLSLSSHISLDYLFLLIVFPLPSFLLCLFFSSHPQTISESQNKKLSLLNQHAAWEISQKNILLLEQRRKIFFAQMSKILSLASL